ncbi:MAG: RNA-binding S4 domain-containing protein [Pseudomonadota bacterium]
MTEPSAPTLRLDKWLWHARFAKSRRIAADLISKPGVRVNDVRVAKPSAPVRPGDVIGFALGRRVVVVRILALGDRRGPATEARLLYEDLSPPPPPRPSPAPAVRDDGAGRPTKAERRAQDRFFRDADG